MSQALRVLRLLRELPRGGGAPHSSTGALAARLGVTERTIYRDLALVTAAGYPVCCDAGGHYLPTTDRATPVDLDAEQVAGLLTALEWVREAVPAAFSPALRTTVEKLAAAHGTRDAVSQLPDADSLRVHPPLTDGPEALHNMAVALRARREGRKLAGVYHSPDRDETTSRVLHPYAVDYRGDAHYLIAFCELRRGVRTFRLDRFTRLEVLQACATIPDKFDLEAHFSGAWQVTSGRRRQVRILLKDKTARRLRSQRVHESQSVRQLEGGELELELHVAITDEFRSWLLGLGGDFEVLSPLSLRREIAQIGAQILSNCRRD